MTGSGVNKTIYELQQEHYELKGRLATLDERFKWQNKVLLECVEVLAMWISLGAGAPDGSPEWKSYWDLKDRTMGLMRGITSRV